MDQPQQFSAKVSEHEELNKKFHLVRLELVKPAVINFQAGQYLSLDIGGGERRAYSICSKPSENNRVELCVDLTPGGKGIIYLKNLQPCAEVKFLGPLGRFTVAPPAGGEKKLLFMATGCGIAPIKSMIYDLLEDKKDRREMWLLWGLRFVEDMFWVEEFREMDEFYKNLHYRLLLSKPPEKWPVEAGHVTDVLEDIKLDKDWGAYLCGNPAMLEEAKVLVKKKGVPETQVHFEKFI